MSLSMLRRHDIVTALRVLAVVVALVAAGAPSCNRGGVRRRVIVLDVSASARSESIDDVLSRALDDLADDDELGVVAFGDGVRATEALRVSAWRARGPSALSALSTPALARASRLGMGLESAAALLRTAADDVRRDVVIVTDARATDTRDDRMRGAFALRAAGCEAAQFERVASHPAGPRVLRVRGPGSARRGDPLTVHVDGVAGAAGARLELLEDARLLAARDVLPGAFRATFLVPPRGAGERTIGARLVGAQADGEARANVVIADAARVLAFADSARTTALQIATGRDVDVRDPTLPGGEIADVAAYTAVVLDGVAARDLSPPTRAALVEHVRGGGGLLVLGGPHAYAQGGWGGGMFERMWPLLPLPPDAPPLLLYLALDGSGSMAERWPGGTGTRDHVVRAAAGELVRALRDGTVVALRRFAGGLLPPGTALVRRALDGGAATDAMVAAVAGLPAPSGATHLLPVLAEAERVAAARLTAPMHAIVFTDARSAESPTRLRAGAQALLSAGGTLTVVAPEDGAVTDVLDVLRSAGAEVRTVAAAADVARTFQQAAATAAAGGAFLDARVARAVAGASERLPGLAAPPGLLRAQRVFAAPDADVLIRTARREPLAAIRREGLGLVAAIAMRAGDPTWLPDGDGGLVRALVGVLSGSAAPELRVERRGAELYFATADDVTPSRVRWSADGAPQEADVRPEARGLWRAAVPPGVSYASLVDADGRVLGGVGLDIPAAPESFHPDAVDINELLRVAAASRPPGGTPLAPWLAGLALLLLVGAHAYAAFAGAHKAAITSPGFK